MTTPTLPAAITSDGSCKVQYATTLADPSAPTVAECNAVTSFDATCYLTDDGWAPSTDEQVVTDGRLCSRQVFEDIGTFTDKLQVKYIYRQQDPDAADNKCFKVWKRGVTGFLIVRNGADMENDIAAGDWVDVYEVRFDTQQKVATTRNEKQKIMQNVRVIGLVRRDVQVVA